MKSYHFGAGPAYLPQSVKERLAKDSDKFEKGPFGIAELGHRSKEFDQLREKIDLKMRKLFQIPKDFEIVFMAGGATHQFALIPLNFAGLNSDPKKVVAEYFNTGYWSQKAMSEASKIVTPHPIQVLLPSQSEWDFYSSQPPLYTHLTHNETIDGFKVDLGKLNLKSEIISKRRWIADFSSSIFSEKIDFTPYSMIYASAQKNLGITGITLILLKKSLLDSLSTNLPDIFSYKVYVKNNSLFNTPPVLSWYSIGLMLDWIEEEGGIEKMEVRNKRKAAKLYETIDKSDFYLNSVDPSYRSLMNVVFKTPTRELDEKFITEAEAHGLHYLAGHRAVGGMRASIYNSMSEEGVMALSEFMEQFQRRNS